MRRGRQPEAAGLIATNMPTRAVAIGATLLLMVVWGTTYIVTKIAIQEFPPLTLAALRFLMAALVLAPFAIAAGGLKRLPRPLPIWTLTSMALTGFVLYYGAFNFALEYGSASQGALIQALIPAAVAIAAVIALKEPMSRQRIAGIVLAIGGVVLIVANGESDSASPNPLLGGFLMFASVAVWAVYTIQVKKLAHLEPAVLLTVIATIATLLQAPLVAFELARHPGPLAFSAQGWASAVFLGAIASGAGLLVYNRVLRVLDASLVGTYINLLPIVGVLCAVVFLGETLGSWQIVGAVLAIAGMWLAS
jgi:drug/metabolite transporter (DMT)-like permease